MKQLLKLLLAVLIISGISHLSISVHGQTNQCGNGLSWQFQVGDTGWVTPEPPDVNLRNAPGGNRIGRLKIRSFFTIVDGPECTGDGTSWWKVEGEQGVIGWVAEGMDGKYFIEPREVTNSECQATAPPRLTVGHYARVLNVSQDFLVYQFAPSDRHITVPNDFSQINLSLSNWIARHAETLLVADGPVCVNSNYIWKFADPPETLNSIWLSESVDGTYLLEPVEKEPSLSETYTRPEVRLMLQDPSPVVNASQQISFGATGGGGNCGGLNGWNNMAYFGEYLCHDDFFPIGEEVSVTFYQPDGELFSTEKLISKGDPSASTGYVRVRTPTEPDLPAGIWTLELQSNSRVHTVAYELKTFPAFYNTPYIGRSCISLKPVIVFAGFDPNQTVELVLVEWQDYSTSEMDFVTLNYKEIYHWTLQVGLQGDLIAFVNFLPESNYSFVVADENRQWVENLDAGGHGLIQLDRSLVVTAADNFASWNCLSPSSLQEAKQHLLEYGDVTFGSAAQRRTFYAFAGREGDTITINTIRHVSISLKGPDNTLLVENRDQISNYVLPTSGTYSIAFSIVGEQRTGDYGLQLLADEASTTSNLAASESTETTAGAVPASADIHCMDSSEPKLKIGETAFVMPDMPNTWYDDPSVEAIPLGQVPTSSPFIVLDGPVCSDGFFWWKVEYHNQTGWLPEGSDSVYWLTLASSTE